MALVVEPLAQGHDRASFSCGVASLDDYIRRQARQDIRRDVAQCYALCEEGDSRIVGYYTLSAAAIDLSSVPPDHARRLPRYPSLPAVLIGRLAVDSEFAGQGMGGLLLADALRRVLQTAHVIGIMAVLVDALDEQAARFYEHFEFLRLSNDPRRLFLEMDTARNMFE